MTGEPQPLRDLVRSWADRKGLDVAVEIGIGDRVRWEGLVGPDLAADGSPISIDGGVLQLQAVNRLGAARLRYSAEAIRTVCNERLGREVIHSIVVREMPRLSGSGRDPW